MLETDGSGATLASYVLADGHMLSQTVAGSTHYTHTDAQGSIRALTSTSGAVAESYDYTAFGDLLQTIPDPLAAYLYTGQRYDATTGQYTLRARQYDPAVGRFLSRDTWAVDRPLSRQNGVSPMSASENRRGGILVIHCAARAGRTEHL